MMIDNFIITGLFGNTTIEIPFDKSNGIRILIGENGTGKTTVLNILYNLLNFNYLKLVQYDFQSINIIFSNNENAFLTIKDVKDYIFFRTKHGMHPEMISEAIKSFSGAELDLLKFELMNEEKDLSVNAIAILRKNRYIRHYPISMTVEALKRYFNSKPSKILTNYENIIKKNGGIKLG